MHRKIVIMGKKMQSVINFCKKEGYLEFPDDILGDLSNVEDQNSILLICDDRENPYASINKVISDYDKNSEDAMAIVAALTNKYPLY